VGGGGARAPYNIFFFPRSPFFRLPFSHKVVNRRRPYGEAHRRLLSYRCLGFLSLPTRAPIICFPPRLSSLLFAFQKELTLCHFLPSDYARGVVSCWRGFIAFFLRQCVYPPSSYQTVEPSAQYSHAPCPPSDEARFLPPPFSPLILLFFQ